MINVSKITGQLSRFPGRHHMAVLLVLLALSATAVFANHSPSRSSEKVPFAPSAKFDSIWIDYDVTENSQIGMRIHVKFTVYGMKGLASYMAIYFETKDGVRLKDRNKKFYSSTGEVAVYRELNPGYETTDYNDLSVFMPYDEFELGDGKWNVQLDVDVIYKAGGLIQHLTFKGVEYTQGPAASKNPPTSSVTATLRRIWVDYDITQNGRKGMIVHINAQVVGLKGIDSMFTVRVQKKGGEYLKNSSSAYSNEDGQLEVIYDLKPGYATTDYNDASVFLPYGEINVGPGKWNLTIDVDLNYEDGELIDHLGYHDFDFTT